MSKLIRILILILLITSGCVNQIKEGERIEQSFPYESILFIENGNKSASGSKSMSGDIFFNKHNIIVKVHSNPNNSDEICDIKYVSYKNDPNIVKYKTDKGTFYTTIVNDTIKEVHWVNTGFSTLFHRRIEPQKISVELPLESSKILSSWKRIKIDDNVLIDLPPEMEIQEDPDGEIKWMINEISKLWDFEITTPKLIFQPKGNNSRDLESLGRYSRVIYETTVALPGDYQKLTEVISLSQDESVALNEELRLQSISELNKQNIKIIKWYPIHVIEVNGMSSLLISYDRQLGDKPYVHVEVYKFFDYDKIHSLTLSYRITEKELWKNKLDIILKSFRIIKFN